MSATAPNRAAEEHVANESARALERHQFVITFFSDQFAKTKRSETVTLPQLAEVIRRATAPSKLELPWLKLASFGNKRSAKSCLRTNANMLEISGVEGDHDSGEMSFDAAVAIMREAGIRCLLYTSASYVPGVKERWRILVPLSKLSSASHRCDLVASVNGLLGGKLADESFTQSQAYLFGSVNDNPNHRVEVLDGDFLDQSAASVLINGALYKGGLTYDEHKDKGRRPHAPRVAARSGPREPVDLVRFALGCFSANCNYEKWLKVAGALYHEYGDAGFDLFDDWSSTATGLTNDGTCIYTPEKSAARWAGACTMDKVSIGTIFHYADQADPTWRERYHDDVQQRLVAELAGAASDAAGGNADTSGAGGSADTIGGSLPVIKLGTLSGMADSAAKVLLDADVPFYQRGNRLVRPVVLPVQTFGGKSATTAQLVEVDIHYLRDTLCQNSRWVKFDGRSKTWRAAQPPTDAAQVLLKRFGDWTFPTIAGIVTTPTLRPDGTILKDAGYDLATQLLLVDPPPMPEIPSSPTRDDALAALQRLKSLMVEFPFAADNGVSLSVALSAHVSTVCRGAYPIVPVHVVDAPTPGSGKSYLLSTISWVGTGQAMPALGAGKNEEELGKRLDAAVVAGQPLVCIDNVVGEIGGDAICRLTEQWRPQVRILGQTQIVNVDARGISFFANGNNVIVVGDFCRRVVRCRLDARSERPELRQFKHNPMEEILADRGAYIAAALTICRAYRVAGRPGLLPQLASYGQWSDTVRSALVWLGEADPVKSQESSHADDPETDALLTLLTEWVAQFGKGALNAVPLREVIERCDMNAVILGSKEYDFPALREAVLSAMPVHHRLRPDASALGYWLRSKKDRRVGRLRFRNKAATDHGPARWWVQEE